MKILWLCVVLQTAFAQSGFGRSYLGNSKLCRPWTCINTRLGLSDSLPTSEEFGNVLRRILPPEWHGMVDGVLNTCYHERSMRYANTCPGQAILHCAVDELNTNCPEANQRKDDACAHISSLAGVKHMFDQILYEDVERNMAADTQPVWFIKNYFNTKCCNLPALINSTTLSECGFTSMIKYYVRSPTTQTPGVLPSQRIFVPISPANKGDSLQIVSLNDLQSENTQTPTDPLDCCDISDFISPAWRQECNFELDWEGQNRLVVKHDTPTTTTAAPVSTSTSSPLTKRDVTIVPQTCEKESCVFNKLNILSSNGTVDIDAFTRLLDNFTNALPTWNSAKGRVVTTCLRRPVTEYDAQCEINKILACTFDVLTENCPYATKSDPCKHAVSQRTCQISSSKYRPKNRREICALPELVDRRVLTECGITSLGKMEPVVTVTRPKTYRLFTSASQCQDLTPSTTCVLTKMGILNKYGFIDYLKMKNKIIKFTSNNDWSILQSYLINAFTFGPLYREHCNSAKKLLNVLDSALFTCPYSRKKNTEKCRSIFKEINNSPYNRNQSKEYATQILNHFLHVSNATKLNPIRPRHIKKIRKAPVFSYGILNNKDAPKVTTIDVKPKKVENQPLVEKQPLVLLPVYMRVPNSNLLIRPFGENGVMRSPFSLHNQIAQAHTSTASPISAQSVSTTRPNSTTQLIPTYKVPTKTENKFEMLKPE